MTFQNRTASAPSMPAEREKNWNNRNQRDKNKEEIDLCYFAKAIERVKLAIAKATILNEKYQALSFHRENTYRIIN